MNEAADRAAITDVLFAFARLVDSGDPRAAADLFTDDCDVNYRRADSPDLHGRSEVARFLGTGLAQFRATDHGVTNVEVTLAGDAASSVCRVQAWHRFADDRPDFTIFGRYVDRWRRTGDGWRISRRRFLVAGTVGRVSEHDEPLPRRIPT